MINLPAAVTAAALVVAPPGLSKYSIAPVVCPNAEACVGQGAVWSEYYRSWTTRETAQQGAARYQTIADAAVQAARFELCRPPDGEDWPACVPYQAARGWSVVRLTSAALGVAIIESGLREDVEVGRGRAKHPDDAGGEGRGPAGEVCLMQVHPATAWRFAPDLDPATPPRDVPDTLVGADPAALVRCFRTGMRMLMQAHSHCAWDWGQRRAKAVSMGIADPQRADAWWEMFSLYGTGDSCTSFNGAKTSIRTTTAYRLLGEVQRQLQRSTG